MFINQYTLIEQSPYLIVKLLPVSFKKYTLIKESNYFVPVNSGIFLRLISIIMSIMSKFFSTAQKHNRQNFEHNRLGLNNIGLICNSLVCCSIWN